METSLFEVDPVTGDIVYEEGEVEESGVYSVEDGDTGSVLQPEEEVQEEMVSAPDSGSGDNIMLLSEEVEAALLASTPAAGSLNSSTIDYFDRLVDGLPSDYGYVAYRNSSDDAYAGTIVYGEDWDCNEDTVVFGEGAIAIDVSRVTGTGYSNYVRYDASDASDSVISLSQSGSILYYTNAVEGYPVLGAGSRPFDIAPFLVVGLITAMAVAVLTKLLCRRG